MIFRGITRGEGTTSWGKVSYDYTSIDPAFMDLLKDAAARLGMEVGAFVVETLRERATAVLNASDPGPQSEIPTWEAAMADEAQKAEEAADRALQEHAAILESLRQGSRSVQRTRRLPQGS